MTDRRDFTREPIDTDMFRSVLGHYPTGVCVVTSRTERGEPLGLTVGSFTSVSLTPALVAVFPDRRSTTWPQIQKTERFCVNILASDQADLCRRFATSGADKFADVADLRSPGELPILKEALAWIDCTIVAVQDAGDHHYVLGAVECLAANRIAMPLIFFRGDYHQPVRL